MPKEIRTHANFFHLQAELHSVCICTRFHATIFSPFVHILKCGDLTSIVSENNLLNRHTKQHPCVYSKFVHGQHVPSSS